jgi:hypothetical protein
MRLVTVKKTFKVGTKDRNYKFEKGNVYVMSD